MNVLGVLQNLAALSPGRTEADIQSDVKILLTEADFLEDEIPLMESPTKDGTGRRIDIEYGALVIECKKNVDPTKKAALADSEEQLASYLATRQLQSHQLYAGILTDGYRWRHYRLDTDGKLDLVSHFELLPKLTDDRPFRSWLGSALPTGMKVVPTADSIAGRLGTGSPSHDITLARLAELSTSALSISEVVLKKELWAKLLRTAFGTQFEGSDKLFVEHTYLVIVATLIARAALGMPPDDPASRLLSGESFAEVGITGVGEAGFFDWMLSVPGGDEIVADVARRVSSFDWSKTDHDVLKALYQSVISEKARHDLGEYYTPDWLADRIVLQTVSSPLTDRVLDPACGSGTFLFAAINHYFEAAIQKGTTTREAVDALAGHVAGIDLHPVAVALAQVTYLLAVGDRIAERGGPFSVPVYLGDSMRWDDALTGAAQLFHTSDDVVVHTTDGVQLFATELRFPAKVVARPDFDALVGEMTSRATSRKPKSARPSIAGILAKYVDNPSEREILDETFNLLCSLHDEGRNHIWGYFVRNQARPAWFTQPANRVDVVVGNPPWLSYHYMPAEMQKRFQTRSKERGLWKGGARGVTTQQELSAFFVARSVELYLKEGGKFAFVTPYGVLSRQSYEGFRTGRWTGKGGPHLGVHWKTAWSLLDIRPQPFPVPSAVVCGVKGSSESYTPLPAVVEHLSGKVRGSGDWNAVVAQIAIGEQSISLRLGGDEHGSPYAEQFRNGATLFPRVLIFVEDGPAAPFKTSGQRSVQSLRMALEKEPWKSLHGLHGAVETQFIRPVLMGESIVPFRVVTRLEAVIPYTTGTGLMSSQHAKIDAFSGFAQWWQKAEEVYMANRPSQKRTLIEQFNYMRQLEAQFPMAPLRVVYTKSGKTIAAALVTDERAVIENSLYWAPVSSLAEGQYLCGVLNAPVFTEIVEPYQSQGAFGARHFDKYIWVAPTPLFDPTNDLHQKLSGLAEGAKEIAAGVARPLKGGFQAHRKLVRKALTESGVSDQLDGAVRELLSMTSSDNA